MVSYSRDFGLFVLRVGVGVMMAALHGWGKLTGYSQISGSFPDPMGIGSEFSLILAIFAEFFCAILVVLGIGTRLAAIPLIITMLVAAFVIHGEDPIQKKEMALLFAIPFFTLMISGGGPWALGRGIKGLARWS